MNKTASLLFGVLAAVALAGCGGGGGEPAPVLVAPAQVALAAAPTTVAAVEDVPFTFPAGVPELGTTGATTLAFTSTGTTPAFSITAEGGTATGTTTFGSCIFAVTASTFPAGHRLALGQTVVVNPCNINVNTAGAAANGVAATRSVALKLGDAVSSGSSVTVQVNPGGQLTLNGNSVGTVTLTPVTG